jgi:hypothetical protein
MKEYELFGDFYWWKQEEASRTIGRRSPQGVRVDKRDGEGRRNPERKVGPQEEWNQKTLRESEAFIRIREDCVQKILPPSR